MRARLETLAAEHPAWFAAGLGLAWHAVLFALAELGGPAAVAWFPDLGAAPWWWQLMVAVVMVAYGHRLLDRLRQDAPVRPAEAPA